MYRFRGFFFRTVVLLFLIFMGYFVSITNLYVCSTFAIALAPKKPADANTEKAPDPVPVVTLDWVSNQNFVQRGEYWVSYYKIRASLKFSGNESITLSTPTDHTLLDNLVILADRWRGPISCSVYTPGTDYAAALIAIQYLRECTSPRIKKLVNFHFFFPRDHIPENIQLTTWEILEGSSVNCSKKHSFGRKLQSYKKSQKLVFPINVARNIARETAQTYFVFPCDIELVPSPNVIPDFLEMMFDMNNTNLQSASNKVFVLPVFELQKTVKFYPKNKAELKMLYDKNDSVSFHKYKCSACHTIPKLLDWLGDTNVTKESVFHVSKRYKWRAIWEPFYIGTNRDPVFDERVTWEGKSNKRIQAYILCVLDYEFHILNKAFLVHRPGIRYLYKKDLIPTPQVLEMNWRIENIIKPELIKLYGLRKGCTV